MSKEVELLQESLAVILRLQDILQPQHEFKAVGELREEIEAKMQESEPVPCYQNGEPIPEELPF